MTFLDELFECEYCDECHGDVEDHIESPDPLGLPHAWCREDAVCRIEGCEEHTA